jgi:hypothetical protein
MVAVFRTIDTDSDARHYLLYHPDSQYAACHLYNAGSFEQIRLRHDRSGFFSEPSSRSAGPRSSMSEPLRP